MDSSSSSSLTAPPSQLTPHGESVCCSAFVMLKAGGIAIEKLTVRVASSPPLECAALGLGFSHGKKHGKGKERSC